MSNFEKPALHISQMNTLFMCGEKFKRIYLDGDFVPSSKDLVIGIATHKPAEANLIHKVENDVLMPIDQVMSIARDAFEDEWNKKEIVINKKDAGKSLADIKGTAIDLTVKLSALHAKECAPVINPCKAVEGVRPHGVERKFRINTGDQFTHDIAGMIDVEELCGIRDLKTSGMNKAQSMADDSLQLTCYSMAYLVLNGRLPEYSDIDMLVKNKVPKYVKGSSIRTQAHFDVFLARFKSCCDAIEKGIFLPSDPTHWGCSPDWCGFARMGTCKYHCKKPTAISMATKQEVIEL